MMDMLQVCGRIMKLDEIRNKKVPSDAAASWPDFLENKILSGIKEAEREVVKTIEQLGMLPLLTSSNILRTSVNGDILYINPGMETVLADVSFVTIDELLELDQRLL